jgi:hypothetical protein
MYEKSTDFFSKNDFRSVLKLICCFFSTCDYFRKSYVSFISKIGFRLCSTFFKIDWIKNAERINDVSGSKSTAFTKKLLQKKVFFLSLFLLSPSGTTVEWIMNGAKFWPFLIFVDKLSNSNWINNYENVFFRFIYSDPRYSFFLFYIFSVWLAWSVEQHFGF